MGSRSTLIKPSIEVDKTDFIGRFAIGTGGLRHGMRQDLLGNTLLQRDMKQLHHRRLAQARPIFLSCGNRSGGLLSQTAPRLSISARPPRAADTVGAKGCP